MPFKTKKKQRNEIESDALLATIMENVVWQLADGIVRISLSITTSHCDYNYRVRVCQ